MASRNQLWRRRPKKPNDTGKVGSAAIGLMFWISAREDVATLKHVPSLVPLCKSIVSNNSAAEPDRGKPKGSWYHAADIPNVNFIAPRHLEDDFRGAVQGGLGVCGVDLLAGHHGAEVAEHRFR